MSFGEFVGQDPIGDLVPYSVTQRARWGPGFATVRGTFQVVLLSLNSLQPLKKLWEGTREGEMEGEGGKRRPGREFLDKRQQQTALEIEYWRSVKAF